MSMSLKFMITLSTLITFMKTPMSMGMTLLIQTMLSTILIAKILKSSWMSMIMFLMLIGGMLILFMYMSSIASNEKFKPNILMVLISMTIIIMMPIENLIIETQSNEKLTEILPYESITLSKIYNKKSMMITIMLFIYLFLAMISVTSIIKIFKGPLRSFKYE